MKSIFKLPFAIVAALAFLLAAPAYGKKGIELKFWEHEEPAIYAVLDELIKEFEKANPGVKVKRSHYKVEDLRTQFQTAAMGGGGGDIILAPNDVAGPFSIMGIVKKVNKWAKLERFDDGVVGAVTNAKGDTWAVPVSKGNHLILFANKKLIKAAPETVEGLIAEAKKLSDPKKNKYGFAYNLNEPFWFVPFMAAYGDRPLKGHSPNLAGAGAADALQLVKDIKFKHKIVPPDCDYSCADTLFVEGKVAMIINGDWGIQKYAKTLGKDLIIAPLPKLKKTGKYVSPMISGKYLFLNNRLKGKKEKAAQAFVHFMASDAAQKKLVKKTRRLPALKGKVAAAIIGSDSVLGASNAALAHGQPMPMAVEMRVVWDAIRPQLTNVMAGRGDPKKASKLMQKDALVKIKEMQE